MTLLKKRTPIMYNKALQIVKTVILLSLIIVLSFTALSIIKEYYQRCEVWEVVEFNRVEILSRRKKDTTKEQIWCKRKTTWHPILDNIKDSFYEKLMWNEKKLWKWSWETTIRTKKVRPVANLLLAWDSDDSTLLNVSYSFDWCWPRSRYVANIQWMDLTIGIIPILITAQVCNEILITANHSLLIPPGYSISFKELSGNENWFVWIF